ncbi:Oxidoreductase, partial [Rhizoctonia solani]
MGLFTQKWDTKDKHCYVTGGSTGLGLCLAKILVKNGAHVSIVARNQDKLNQAITELESLRVSPAQIIKSYSFSLTDSAGSVAALDAASAPFEGRAPDALFLCAGASRPRFFIDDDTGALERGMRDAYWIQAYTAHAGIKKMVRQKVHGKIVFVGSMLSYMSFMGWSNYAPGKHALRGLADGLASECQLYDISVQMYFPCTMETPGYEEENKLKPDLLKKLEETDKGMTPEAAAEAMYKGIQSGQQHISGDLLTSIFRAGTRGITPNHNPLVDSVLALIAWIGIPIWRWTVDSAVKGHKKEHAEYLVKHGHVD